MGAPFFFPARFMTHNPRVVCSVHGAPLTRRVAVSVKRPQWVLAGFSKSLKAPKIHKLSVHGTDLAAYHGPGGELCIVRDACAHRGASLACGKEARGGIVCPYHGMTVSMKSHPGHHFDYAALQGLVWVDYASGLLTQHHMPPTYPEFDDPALRTFEYTKTLRVNPVLMTENTLDWQHLASVHRVHFVDGTPRVSISGTGAHGLATYTYSADLFDLVIENEYHIPFTTSLRFKFTDKKTGHALPTLLLWFSLTPLRDGETRINLRVSRGVLRAVPWLTDWIFRLLDELPLAEDIAIVNSLDPTAWSSNRLTPGDAFVQAYRDAMADNFPEVLEWYVS